jgi:magnesium chelatase family protein
VQKKRFGGLRGGPSGNVNLLVNADMGPAEVREYCRLDDAGKSLVRSAPQGGTQAAMQQLGMSARAFHRTAKRLAITLARLRSVKLSRTIADLEGAADIKTHHLAEAIQYRPRSLA